MIVLVYAFIIACFMFGIVLQHFLPRHRGSRLFWIITLSTGGALYAFGKALFIETDVSVGFLLSTNLIAGFLWHRIGDPLKRWMLPRFRRIMPYLTLGFVLIIVSSFMSGNQFMISAVTLGIFFALFGGLWTLINRLRKPHR